MASCGRRYLVTGCGTVCWNALPGALPVEPLGAAAVVFGCVLGVMGGLVEFSTPGVGTPDEELAAPAGKLLFDEGAAEEALVLGGDAAEPCAKAGTANETAKIVATATMLGRIGRTPWVTGVFNGKYPVWFHPFERRVRSSCCCMAPINAETSPLLRDRKAE